MKVAHFIATNFVGGPENQILRHCEALREQKHQVCLISFDEEGGRSFLLKGKHLSQSTLALKPEITALLDNLRELSQYLQQEEVDLVVAHGYKATILGALTQKRSNTPAVAFSRGWTGENRKVRLYEWLDRRFIRLHQKIIAVSESQRARLINHGIPDSKIEVIHNAYLTDNLPERSAQRDNDTPTLLTAGRLSPEKGHRYLLEAFAEVVQKRPRCRLLIAGDGPERGQLENLAKELHVSEHLEFLGFVENMADQYEAATAFVLPSLSEGLPNVILESYYWALPVIATAVGGVPEIVENGVSGLLCKPQDPPDLARAINETLDDLSAAGQRAEVARAVLVDRFGIQQQTKLLLEVYRRAIQ